MTEGLKSPYTFFGGKSRIAAEVWARFGKVRTYTEPFFGSGAVLLARPDEHRWWDRIETVNDLDGMISNFWRAVQRDPDAVAHWVDWPINECDLTARHIWLVEHKAGLVERLMADPDFYDAKAAGYWVWGICQWVGIVWCAGDGPWHAEDGVLARGDTGTGVYRQRPALGHGMGVHRQLPDASGADGHCEAWSAHLLKMMRALADRLRRVRVCCGDWSCVLFPSMTNLGLTGIFLDPPYSAEVGRDMRVYVEDSGTVARDAAQWAREHGDDPLYRIALCGYEGEHDMPGWEVYRWKAKGGYGSQGDGRGKENRHRETVWFSPHCSREGKRRPLGE